MRLIPDSWKTTPHRRFSDLRVRQKLIVLTNVFFLALAATVYFALIPVFEERLSGARRREAMTLGEMFLVKDEPLPFGELSAADRRRGPAEEINIPFQIKLWLDKNPGRIYHDDDDSPGRVYRRLPDGDQYQSLRLPSDFYEGIVERAKLALFVAVGVVYALGVLVLEFFIMPRYVYRPIRATLDSDEAVQLGDREHELIEEEAIPGDEIGDIMRSRNATVVKLREKEANLERALKQLETLADDLRRKNEQLETARRGMAAQDRLATIGLLSASVAHELNTPLTVLAGSIEQSLETVSDPSECVRLARMKRMTERLRTISEGLLDFSRARGEEERRPVPIGRLVDEAWSLLALDERSREVAFFNRIDKELRVLGDYDRLMQVFINLLRNGMNAVGEGGRITVRSSAAETNGERWATINVDDDGPGIPEDVLPNIFEAFVSTRLDSRGTGLGLTVAEGIVQRHGGRIRAANRPEGGARLEVRLPAA